ncbi:MAG: hypothetical protein ABIQ04_01085 [Candidatus Saccharimonadales bacterium]
MGILLVLGSVRARQYSRMRQAMQLAGMKPQVLRIKGPIPSIEDVMRQVDADMKGTPVDELKWDARYDQIKQDLLITLFGDQGLAGIDAIVQEEPDATHSNLDFWGCIDDATELDVPYYIVRKGEDGSHWLDGTGFEGFGIGSSRSEI